MYHGPDALPSVFQDGVEKRNRFASSARSEAIACAFSSISEPRKGVTDSKRKTIRVFSANTHHSHTFCFARSRSDSDRWFAIEGVAARCYVQETPVALTRGDEIEGQRDGLGS